ncbi:MAG: biotin/lipoate A/B protein ligase family protein [Methanomassiliicoccales archaeon]
MDELQIIRMGAVDGQTMTNAFAVLAHSVSTGRRGDTLVICHAENPFANVGFHQSVDEEIDLDYCRRNGIPVVRRLIGGGAIADGPWEEDYFLICSHSSPYVRGSIQEYYSRMLEPVAKVLDGVGIRATKQGLNDLAVNGRKISANGAVDIESARVLTGDILLWLDVETMSSILKVPDAKFRDKLAKSMKEHLTSVENETGKRPDREGIDEAIISAFSQNYGRAFEDKLDSSELGLLMDYIRERSGDDWIFSRDMAAQRLREGRLVKLREGAYLCRYDHKAQKLIRVTMLVEDGKIADIAFAGDFFTIPVNWSLRTLESELTGAGLTMDELRGKIESVLHRDGVTVLGASPEDFATAILRASDHPEIRANRSRQR